MSNDTHSLAHSTMGFLKGKSTVLIYQQFTNPFLKYRHREFWCTRYYVDTVGKNTKKIKEYIANQYKQDKINDQISMFEKVDPFKSKVVCDTHSRLRVYADR